jgi:hypothetical protein
MITPRLVGLFNDVMSGWVFRSPEPSQWIGWTVGVPLDSCVMSCTRSPPRTGRDLVAIVSCCPHRSLHGLDWDGTGHNCYGLTIDDRLSCNYHLDQ